MPGYTWELVQYRIGERTPLRGRGQVVFEGSVWGPYPTDPLPGRDCDRAHTCTHPPYLVPPPN